MNATSELAPTDGDVSELIAAALDLFVERGFAAKLS